MPFGAARRLVLATDKLGELQIGTVDTAVELHDPGQVDRIAFAEDLTAFSAAAVKSSLADLPKVFQQSTGKTVRFEYGTAGAMRDKAMQGDSVDVIIVRDNKIAALYVFLDA